MNIERHITTRATIDHCYRYLAAFHKVVEWDSTVVAARKVTAGTPAIGTRFEVDITFLGRTSRLQYTIVDAQPPALLQLRGEADGYSVTDTIRFTTDADGRTRIDYVLQVDYSPALRVVAPLFAPLVLAGIDRAIAGLQRALDDEPEAPVHYPAWRDRCMLPGMLDFTRRGYLKAKRQWKGLASDLSGQTILVTGATSGLGRAATLALAGMGASVIAVGRDPAKGRSLVEAVRADSDMTVRFECCDLSSIADTSRLAAQLCAEDVAIDCLINNAGALFNERIVTPEGLEKSFALLLASPFALTEALLPCLRRVPHARVINVSSGGMYTQPVVIDDLAYERGTYDGPKAYARAKRGLVDMTRDWAQRYPDIAFHAMHPGWADTEAVREALPAFYKLTRRWLRTPVQGADTIVWLAASSDAVRCNGQFWLDRKVHATELVPGTASSPALVQALRQALITVVKTCSPGTVFAGE